MYMTETGESQEKGKKRTSRKEEISWNPREYNYATAFRFLVEYYLWLFLEPQPYGKGHIVGTKSAAGPWKVVCKYTTFLLNRATSSIHNYIHWLTTTGFILLILHDQHT